MVNSLTTVLEQENIKIKISKIRIAIYTVSMGFVFVFLVGLSSPMTLHNAAHDVRHSAAFPCH